MCFYIRLLLVLPAYMQYSVLFRTYLNGLLRFVLLFKTISIHPNKRNLQIKLKEQEEQYFYVYLKKFLFARISFPVIYIFLRSRERFGLQVNWWLILGAKLFAATRSDQ